MKSKTKRNAAAASALVIGLAVMGAGIAHVASADTITKTNPMSSLVTAISQKFNLNTADVQKVFDDQRAQMEAQHKQAETTRLAQAVTDGKLTQAQADAITAKKAELAANRQAFMTSLQGKTQAERQAAMKAQEESLKQWMTDNNIPQQYMFGLGGPHAGFRGGHGNHGPRSMNNSSANKTVTQ